MKKAMYDWCGHFHRQIQRTDECFGHASTTEFTVDIRHLLEELDVINERNHKILHGTERVLKRNPGLTTQEYIYQKKEKKGSTRTNALIQLGNEMIFAGRQFGEATTYGKCLLSAGRCQEELGHEELRYVTQVAMVFLTPLRRFMETGLKQALKERRALSSSRLELDYARQRQKKAKTPEKQVQAEGHLRSSQAKFERQLELTRIACETVQREKVQQIKGLMKFVDAQLDHYNNSAATLETIKNELLQILKAERGFDFDFEWPALNYDAIDLSREGGGGEEGPATAPEVPKHSNLSLQPVHIAKITDEFSGNTASEITVTKDEVVTVMETTPGGRDTEGWSLIRKASGQVGYVPRDHLALLEENDNNLPSQPDVPYRASQSQASQRRTSQNRSVSVTRTPAAVTSDYAQESRKVTVTFHDFHEDHTQLPQTASS